MIMTASNISIKKALKKLEALQSADIVDDIEEFESPVAVSFIPFTRYSNFAKNSDNKNRKSQIRQKNIITGGNETNEGGFYEFIGNDDAKSIDCKSFKIDYNKEFANLQCIGLGNAHSVHSYLIQNNKYLVVFKRALCYNVYDMENDKWLINLGAKKLTANISSDARSVMINDNLIIISNYKHLYFYFIGDDHITNPILIGQRRLKARNVGYLRHGMCIIDFIEDKKSLNDYTSRFKFKIILFGGRDAHNGVLSSFLYLDVWLPYSFKHKSYLMDDLFINEQLISKRQIKLKNTEKIQEYEWSGFGLEVTHNSKNHPVIVIIGGYQMGKDIHLFNCVTHELAIKRKV